MKKFSTSLSKASKIAAAQQHTALIGEQLSAPIRKDDFANVERIPVYAIRPDPDQARQLGITLALLRDPESVTDTRIREKVDHIVGLSQSLQEMGQQTPVEVYRDGSNFRLVTGERRWWAAQLAGLDALVAKVLPERPDDLRLKQFVENAVRVDFTPAETLDALRGVVEESERLHKPLKTAKDLQRRLGIPYSSVHRWWSILHGPQDVIAAILEQDLPIRVAGELARIDDESQRQQAIADALSGGSGHHPGGPGAKAPAPKSKKRATQRLSFGSTSNLAVGRLVLQRLRGSEPSGSESKSLVALAKAIRAEVAKLEREIGAVEA
jgi:ParB family chromosome partitioning protein